MPKKRTGRPPGRPPFPDPVTPAEQRVLELVRDGLTNVEIAIRLGISPDGVKYHVSNMLSKLQLERREQLATWRPALPLTKRVRAGLGFMGLFAGAAGVVVGIAVGGVALYRSIDGGEEPVSSGSLDTVDTTPVAVSEPPPCRPDDITVRVRVEPWVHGNLITIESVNDGRPCWATAVGATIFPSPGGGSSISLPARELPAGEQEPIQLVWVAWCSEVGRLFDVRGSVASVTMTVANVPARGGCDGAGGGVIYPAEKGDSVNGVALPPLPACRTSQLALGRAPGGQTDGSLATVRVSNSGEPCRLRGSLSVEVLDPTGQLVDRFFGNLATVPVYADLDRELSASSFAWENWCAPAALGDFTFRLALGGLTASWTASTRGCEVPE